MIPEYFVNWNYVFSPKSAWLKQSVHCNDSNGKHFQKMIKTEHFCHDQAVFGKKIISTTNCNMFEIMLTQTYNISKRKVQMAKT